MAQTNRTPRSMTNKFDSTCGDCGRAVDKGETILYHGRGYIQCNDCAPANTIPNNAKPTNEQSWSDMLSWDDSQPEKGASIGGVATPVKSKPVEVVSVKSADTGQPVNVVTNDPSGLLMLAADQLADTGATIIEQASAKSPDGYGPQAKADPIDDISVTDRAEALTTELLIILVNAIDVAGISGRHTLAEFSRDMAKGALHNSTREQLWIGISNAIRAS